MSARWIVAVGVATLFSAACAPETQPQTQPDGGAPAPVTLIDGASPYAIELDDTRIYWSDTDQDAIYSVRKDGSDIRVLASGIKSAPDLGVDSDYLYAALSGTWNAVPEYQHDGSIVRIPKSGGAPEILAAPLEYPLRLAVDGGWVYWVNAGAPNVMLGVDPGPGSVMRVPVTGGTPEVLAADQLTPNSLVVRDGFVYWTNWGTINNSEGTPNGGVFRVPTGGGPIEVIAGAQSEPRNLVYGNEFLWIVHTHSISGSLVALRNGQVIKLGKERQNPGSMGEYAGTIVWRFLYDLLAMDGETGALTETWPNDGCGPETLPIWVGPDGVFWGCAAGNAPGAGEMRFIEPW